MVEPHLPSSRRCLTNDRGGTTALEFALLAGPLFGFIIGMMCLGLQLLTVATLDAVVEEVGRQLQIGTIKAASTGNADQNLRDVICPRLGGLAVNCNSDLKIYVNSASTFAALNPVPSPMTNVFNPGKAGSPGQPVPVTVVQVSCVSPFLVPLINLPGTLITSTALYRSYQ